MPRLLLAVTFLLLGGCAAPRFTFSREALLGWAQMPPPMTHLAQVATLETGLRVVAFRVEGEQDVAAVLSFQGGISAEPPGKEGVARLAAFLADQASPGRGGVRLGERHYAAGTRASWLLNQDELALQILAKPSKLAEVVQIEGRRLQDPADGITEEQVKRAREYFADELERSAAGASQQAMLVEARAMEGTAYGRPPPTPEGLRKLTLQDVGDYLRAVLRPERAILTVATGAPPEATVKAVSAIALDRPGRGARPAPAAALFDPPAVAGATETLVVKTGQRRLWLAWAVPGSRELEEPWLQIVAWSLREQAILRLRDERLRDQVGEVITLSWWRNSAGLIAISVVLKPGADPERVRKVVEGSTKQARESASGRLLVEMSAGNTRRRLELDRYIANEGRPPLGEVARWMRTSREGSPGAAFHKAMDGLLDGSARRRMAGYFASDPAAAVLFVPRELGPEEAPEDPSIIQQGREWSEASPFDRGAAPGAEAVRALLDPPGLDRARRKTLASGLEVVVLARKGIPLVHSVLYFRGTNGFSEMARIRANLAAPLAAQSLRCGTPMTHVGVDGLVLQSSTTLAGLRFGLEALSCWFALAEAGLGTRPLTPQLKARLELDDAAFLAGPPPAIDDQPDWGDRWIRRAVRSDRATLAVVGDVDPEAVFAMAAEVFGDLKTPQGPSRPALRTVAWPPPARRTTVVSNQGSGAEGWAWLVLRATGEAPGGKAERGTLAKLLEARLEQVLLLGGFKIFVESASVEELHELNIRITGRSDRLAPALKRALDELASVHATIDDPVAVATARWNLARGWAFAFNPIGGAALGVVDLASGGLPPDGFERLGQEIAGVTPERLHAVASRYSIGKEGIRIAGPFDLLAPKLKELGLDPIRAPDREPPPGKK